MANTEQLKFIMILIKLVKDVPDLHDPQNIDNPRNYESWKMIADNMDSEVSIVKKNWKELCSLYDTIRHNKNPSLENSYPYVLKLHMWFMKPIFDKVIHEAPSKRSHTENDLVESVKKKIVLQNKGTSKNQMPSLHADISYLHTKRNAVAIWCDETETECRKNFLLSLLTDMSRMTPTELNKFKNTLTILVENILIE